MLKKEKLKFYFLNILFFLIFFLLISQDNRKTPTKKETPFSLPEQKEEKLWKEFTHQETGLHFKYPLEWQDFYFVLSASFGSNSLHWEGYGGKEADLFARPFRFLLYSKDYFPFNFANFAFSATTVNPDWNLSEFSEKMGIPLEKLFFVEKLGEKSVLVAFREDVILNPYEALPHLSLVVLAPFTPDYPNLEIRIRYNFYQEPLLQEVIKNKNLSSEERYSKLLSLLKEIAKRVKEKTYSPELNYLIDTAQFVADSLEKN